LAAVGCGLRCRFCYRPGNLNAAAGNEADPVALARGIDAAADCRHVHWLGGDPDESLPGILTVHRLVRIDRPLVWNTHSYLTPAQARLLEGVVDGFVADLKFGPGACGERLAGIKGYWPAATATLGRLAAFNSRLLLRHVLLPGHLECCARPVVDWLLQQPWLAAAAARVLVQYEPLGARGELGRHLSAEEEAAASLLNARLAERTGW
ncbi:MAG: radical SAM protein, partial [Armatimonadetes bacterium]|nr:radical SAM protein [Armatimonadota bacterium]